MKPLIVGTRSVSISKEDYEKLISRDTEIEKLIEKYNGYWYEKDYNVAYHSRDVLLIEIKQDLKSLFKGG